MKKRSLVASIAMLVVSAIVLTSATYAWFSTSNQAKVNTIEVDVVNNSSNLGLKATGDYSKNPDNAQPKTRLTRSDYFQQSDTLTTAQEDAGKKQLADFLNPVSMSYATGDSAPSFKSLDFDGTYYSGLAAADESDYLTYDFQIVYDNPNLTAATITVAPTLTTGTTNNQNGFIYGVIKVVVGSTTEYYFIAPDSNTYTPVTAISSHNFGTESAPDNQTKVEENQAAANSIIDTNDTGTWTAGALTGFDNDHKLDRTGDSFTFDASTTATQTTATITVYIWAEGQDANCIGTASADNAGISFDISAA